MRRAQWERSRREIASQRAKELRTQRLGFVTGSLLAWGTTFAGLHGYLRTMPAPSARELYFDDASRLAHAYDYDSVDFVAVSYLVGFGFSVVFIAALYLIDYGLSLRSTQARASAVRSQPGVFLYDSLFALMAFIALAVLVGVPGRYAYVWVHRMLVLDLGVPAATAVSAMRWGGGILFFVVVALILWLWPGKDLSARLDGLTAKLDRWEWTPRRGYFLAVLLFNVYVFGFFGSIAVETAFTAELSTNKRVYDKKIDRDVEVMVMLGGATSDPDKATLTLRSQADNRLRRVLTVDFESGPGKRVALVPIAELPAGIYRVDLRYRRTLAFASWALDREASFAVGP